MIKNGITALLSVACIGVVCAVSSPAKAATVVDCTVNTMLVRDSYMQFTCVGSTNTWNANPPGVCPANVVVPMDIFKIWVSMVQAAFLSGKRLDFDWADNGCTHAVTQMLLVP